MTPHRAWSSIAGAMALSLAFSGPAIGQTYRWTDERGQVHITDNLSDVPEKYRPNAAPSRPAGAARTEPAQSSGADQAAAAKALRALKALRSATRAGVIYRDYGPRLADTRVEVDAALEHLSNRAAAAAIEEAMAYYEAAATAWQYNLRRAEDFAGQLVARYRACRHVQRLLADPDVIGGSSLVSEDQKLGIRAVSTLFACGADAIDEAQALAGGR